MPTLTRTARWSNNVSQEIWWHQSELDRLQNCTANDEVYNPCESSWEDRTGNDLAI